MSPEKREVYKFMKERIHKGVAAVLVIVLVLVLDQVSKVWVKTNMALYDSIEITKWFKIYFVENNGMAFGIETIYQWLQ